MCYTERMKQKQNTIVTRLNAECLRRTRIGCHMECDKLKSNWCREVWEKVLKK